MEEYSIDQNTFRSTSRKHGWSNIGGWYKTTSHQGAISESTDMADCHSLSSRLHREFSSGILSF